MHPQQSRAESSSNGVAERALVLGGGGAAGNAWEIGVLAGLFDAGADVTDADLIIGTSAGSTVAAQISAARPTELLAAILAQASSPPAGSAGSGGTRSPGTSPGTSPTVRAAAVMEKTGGIIRAAKDQAEMRRRLGAAALEADAAAGGSRQAQWRATVATRLPSQDWPRRRVHIVAVDADTGEPVVFDRHSGVD